MPTTRSAERSDIKKVLLSSHYTMRVNFIIFLFIFAFVSCATKVDEQTIFKDELICMSDDYTRTAISFDNTFTSSSDLGECIIKDSLIFSISRGEYLYHISNLYSDELVASLCKRGRANNELITTLPLSEFFEINGQTCANLFSFVENKLVLWNVDASLSENKDIYESIVYLENEHLNSLMSLWRLDDSHLLAYNSYQDPNRMTNNATPQYVEYNIETGQVNRKFDIFNNVKFPESSIPEMLILSNVDCIKPDRKQIAFAMSYMPVLNIMDIKSGKVHSYILPNETRLNFALQRWCFADIVADDGFIYALYSGEELYKGDGTDIPKVLYVFDWNGNIKMRATLDDRFTLLHLVNDILFLSNPNGEIAEIKLSNLKLNAI